MMRALRHWLAVHFRHCSECGKRLNRRAIKVGTRWSCLPCFARVLQRALADVRIQEARS